MECEACKKDVDDGEIYGHFYYCSECDKTFSLEKNVDKKSNDYSKLTGTKSKKD